MPATHQEGHIIVAAGNDGQFNSLCRIARRPDLAADPRFGRNSGRVANRAVLVPILEVTFREQTSAWWLAALETASVPCGPINDLSQVWEDPQVQYREMKTELVHPLSGRVPTIANPLRLSLTPVSYRAAPPILGADTHAVLEEMLGWTEEQIAELGTEPNQPQEPGDSS